MRAVKTLVATLIVATMFLTTMPVRASAAYSDVPQGYWASDYITYAQQNGIMSGVGDGRFAPEDTLVMSQVCQILFNLSGQSVNTGMSPWYAQAVSFVQQRTGLSIDPSDICSRAMACRLIYRMANGNTYSSYGYGNGYGYNNSYGYNQYGYTSYFSDTTSLDAETQVAIAYCVERGIVAGGGDGKFYPNRYLTRAQAAKIFSIYSGGTNIGTSSTTYVPTTQTATPTAVTTAQQTNSGTVSQMVATALNVGLYAEAQGQNLVVYTPDGYYTYTLNGNTWSVRATNGRVENTDATFIQRWLTEASRKYTDAQKISTAKEEIFERLENLGFMPELLGSYNNGSTITFDPFGGVSSSYVPSAAANYAGSTTLSLSGGALLVQGYQNWSVTDYLATIEGALSRLTATERVNLSVRYVETLCRSKGWSVTTESAGGNSVRLRCYPAGSSSYYVFVVGFSGGNVSWSNEANGRTTTISRESVKMVIR